MILILQKSRSASCIPLDPAFRSGRAAVFRVTLEQSFLYLIVCSTILAQLGETSFGGFSFRGWAWVLVLVASGFFLLPHRYRRSIHGSWWIWLPWIAWMIEKTNFTNREAVQRFFIFLTPLLTLYVCSSFRHVTVSILKKNIHVLAAGSILLYLAAVLTSGSPSASASWYTVAGIAMTFTLLAVSEWAGLRTSKQSMWLWLLIYIGILFVTESRMPVLVIPMVMIFGFSSQRPVMKCLLAAGILLVGGMLFYTEPVQQNLFHKEYGTLAELFSFDPEIVNLSGRLTAWPQFLAGIENRWLGDGSTSSAVFGYATFRGWTHPHNEYIRILFDYGYIGFLLLAVPVLFLFASLFQNKQRNRSDAGYQWLHITAMNGLLAMLLLGISGNVLMYIAYIGNILFAFIGCSFAISREPS